MKKTVAAEMESAVSKIDLLTPYERLACYRCRAMQISNDKRYAWCERHEPEFPLMCNQYRGTNG